MRVLRVAALFVPDDVRRLLRRVPGASPLYMRLVAGDGYTIGRVREGTIAGAKLVYDPRAENQYCRGNYEPDTQAILASLPLDGCVAWDVGAHIGFFSLVLARRCRQVIAIEPGADAARRLRTNAELNEAPIEVIEAAAGAASGTARLELAADGRMNRVAANGVAVRQVTLDELAAAHGLPDLVKIDVEGAELDVLAGAKAVLAHRPFLLAEAHTPELLESVTALLEDAGYEVEQSVRETAASFTPALLVARPFTG
jgi:FkbM family methyltransferase